MKRIRKDVDGFMGWFTYSHLVESLNFVVVLLAMTGLAAAVMAGWMPVLGAMVLVGLAGLITGATAMWLVNFGRLEDAELLKQRRDLAVDNATAIAEASIEILHTPPAGVKVEIADLTPEGSAARWWMSFLATVR